MPRPRIMAASALLLVSVLSSACSGGGAANRIATLGGGSGASASSSSSGDKQSFEDAMLDFARCMREHGVDMPDPTFNGNGGVAITGSGKAGGPGPGDATFEAAQKACQPIMDAAEQNAPKPTPEEEAKMRDQALAFAQCMREHGVDVPDPTFDDNGHTKIEIHGSGPSSDGSSSSNDSSSSDGDNTGPTTGGPKMDPKFQAAAETCQQEGHGGPMFGTSAGGDQ